MNTYKVNGKIVKGVNLDSAIRSLGFTGVNIVPLWNGTSNGHYKAYCNETAILLCEWIEKCDSLEENYYQREINKINFNDEYAASIKITDTQTSTKQMSLNKDSASVIVKHLIKEFDLWI